MEKRIGDLVRENQSSLAFVFVGVLAVLGGFLVMEVLQLFFWVLALFVALFVLGKVVGVRRVKEMFGRFR